MITDRLPPLVLPSGAAQAYLHGEWSASHLHFKRLRASVSAKQEFGLFVGAGLPAKASSLMQHCIARFAGKPAPTGLGCETACWNEPRQALNSQVLPLSNFRQKKSQAADGRLGFKNA
ncbi:hypothetical protein [Pseudomonas sp. P8_241]|uniref:hypothetical protein n=1 Tax=Pseudomonas sp. P8_241 TaxID=3043445 RepID=UPI002A3679B9|nr:hypothetical protein [Pseudomonas sp. P8_241]WPN50017.1 hypothetical protein QMK58_11600 [Pseudomonas sp. P8_241]